jgi:hypothetical protein
MEGRRVPPDATECNETCNAADPRQARALERLLAGLSPAAVARELDIDRTTLWRWRAAPGFAVRYRDALDARASDAAVRLDAAAGAALDLLEGVIESDVYPIATRVRAAESVLRHAALTRPAPPGPDVPRTDEERIQQVVEALRDIDPAVAEALRRVGLDPEAITR